MAAGGRDDPDVAACSSLIAHEAADESDGFSVGRPAWDGDLEAVEGAGNLSGIENGFGLGTQHLGVKRGDPPVVLSGRIGCDVGEGFGIGRPIELVDVEIGGRGKGGRYGLGGICQGDGYALNFDTVLADHAGRGLHGGQCPGRACGIRDIKEGYGVSIGGKRRGLDVTVELGEAAGRGSVEAGEVEIGLVAGTGTIGEEGQSRRVRSPGQFAFATALPGHRGRGYALCFAEIVEGRDTNLSSSAATFYPGEVLAIGRDRDLTEGLPAIEAVEHLLDTVMV